MIRLHRVLCFLNFHRWTKWAYTGTVRIPREEGVVCGVRVTLLGCCFDYHQRHCEWCDKSETTSLLDRAKDVAEHLLPVNVVGFVADCPQQHEGVF